MTHSKTVEIKAWPELHWPIQVSPKYKAARTTYFCITGRITLGPMETKSGYLFKNHNWYPCVQQCDLETSNRNNTTSKLNSLGFLWYYAQFSYACHQFFYAVCQRNEHTFSNHLIHSSIPTQRIQNDILRGFIEKSLAVTWPYWAMNVVLLRILMVKQVNNARERPYASPFSLKDRWSGVGPLPKLLIRSQLPVPFWRLIRNDRSIMIVLQHRQDN